MHWEATRWRRRSRQRDTRRSSLQITRVTEPLKTSRNLLNISKPLQTGQTCIGEADIDDRSFVNNSLPGPLIRIMDLVFVNNCGDVREVVSSSENLICSFFWCWCFKSIYLWLCCRWWWRENYFKYWPQQTHTKFEGWHVAEFSHQKASQHM